MGTQQHTLRHSAAVGEKSALPFHSHDFGRPETLAWWAAALAPELVVRDVAELEQIPGHSDHRAQFFSPAPSLLALFLSPLGDSLTWQ